MLHLECATATKGTRCALPSIVFVSDRTMERRNFLQYLAIATVPAAVPIPVSAQQAICVGGNQSAVPDARTTAPLDVPAAGVINAGFLISKGAEIVDFGGPWGVLEYVYVGTPPRNPFRLYTVAATQSPVTVSGGMVVVPNFAIEDAPKPDILIIPAMDLSQVSPEVLEWIRLVHETTQVTMSVCNGSFVLAKAGVLDGRTATAHHGGAAQLKKMFPRVNVIKGKRWVEDGRLATAGGLTSGQDLALRLVERYFGREVAKATATELEYLGNGWMNPDTNWYR
jgi:putative intracellular protease/amidase